MPSKYSSAETQKDARQLAKNLNMSFKEIRIDNLFQTYLNDLKKEFNHLAADATEENIQARIRGNLLMALSNKFGYLVLTTGNKSEVSCGYCTLYGDMAGGFNILKDVYKMLVYTLCRYRNTQGLAIPESIITRPPSAELKPQQKDQDTLPPYPILDKILKQYIEKDHSYAQIIQDKTLKPALVKKIIQLVDKNEYKRRQAPPGLKITPKAFGRDRRMPITNKYTCHY